MYHQFYIQHFYVCPLSVFLFFVIIWEQQHSFPYTTLTVFFHNRDLSLCSTLVTICTTSLTFNNSTFCPHSVYMCFVWIWEQTAIISLYNITCPLSISQSPCVYITSHPVTRAQFPTSLPATPIWNLPSVMKYPKPYPFCPSVPLHSLQQFLLFAILL